MIDIHTHILPNIDDGSQDMEDSMLMAELAVESGVRIIVSTPHCNIPGGFENYWSNGLKERFINLQQTVRKRKIPLHILTGMEIYATEDVAEKIKKGMLIPINHSRYYLMEFGFNQDPEWMTHIIDSVLKIGAVPVIAHPERYECIQDDIYYVEEWMKMGCLTQVNKGSYFGRFGRTAMRTVIGLMEENLITCIASDGHSPYRRTTYMGDIKELLCEEFSEGIAEKLLVKNPGKIIKNEEL